MHEEEKKSMKYVKGAIQKPSFVNFPDVNAGSRMRNIHTVEHSVYLRLNSSIMKLHPNKGIMIKSLQNGSDGFWMIRTIFYSYLNGLPGVLILIYLLFQPKSGIGQEVNPVFNPGDSVEKLAGDFSFTEGP